MADATGGNEFLHDVVQLADSGDEPFTVEAAEQSTGKDASRILDVTRGRISHKMCSAKPYVVTGNQNLSHLEGRLNYISYPRLKVGIGALTQERPEFRKDALRTLACSLARHRHANLAVGSLVRLC